MKINFTPKVGRLVASFFIFHGILMACTPEEQRQARSLFTQAHGAESYSDTISLLNASLESCFSSYTQSELYLTQGDLYYDSGDYVKAKLSYNGIMQEVDNIRDPKLKNRYRLLYYKSMKDVYQKMGKDKLVTIMQQKYK